MRRKLAAAFAAVMMLVGAPAALAQPPTTSPAPSAGKSTPFEMGIQASDGYFYAWQHAGYVGAMCRWQGAVYDYRNPYDTNWPKDCDPPPLDGGMDDIVSSVFNNAFSADNDSVRMYRGYSAAFGPAMCIDRGDYWGDLSLGYERFDNGENANDKISSHRWVFGCP